MAMRITADVVRALATAADEAAADVAKAHGKEIRDAVHYGAMSSGPYDDGSTKIIASHRMLNWKGRQSTQRAAAYYLGVIDALKANAYLGLTSGSTRLPGAEEWPTVREVLWANWQRTNQEYGRGLDEGNQRRTSILA